LRHIATLSILLATLPRRAPIDGRILSQEARISAQRKARIRANITATEKIAIEPHLAHFTQAYRARPSDESADQAQRGFVLELLRQHLMQQADRLQRLAQIMAGGGEEP
jgi:hypothetical protein